MPLQLQSTGSRARECERSHARRQLSSIERCPGCRIDVLFGPNGKAPEGRGRQRDVAGEGAHARLEYRPLGVIERISHPGANGRCRFPAERRSADAVDASAERRCPKKTCEEYHRHMAPWTVSCRSRWGCSQVEPTANATRLRADRWHHRGRTGHLTTGPSSVALRAEKPAGSVSGSRLPAGLEYAAPACSRSSPVKAT